MLVNVNGARECPRQGSSLEVYLGRDLLMANGELVLAGGG
jgi:hypothetical protein